MLTSAYYYGVYMPYILSGRETGPSWARSRQLSGNLTLERNNSIKEDFVDYANNVCKNVTETSDAARDLIRNSETYYLTVLDDGYKSAMDWAVEDISSFVNAYNSAAEFCLSQNHSAELTGYGQDLLDIAESFGDELKQAGVYAVNGGRTLSVNINALRNMDYMELGAALTNASKVASSVYDRTSQLLSAPLTDFMDFKQLSYYYNYAIGGTGGKAPVQLLAGILLDKVI